MPDQTHHHQATASVEARTDAIEAAFQERGMEPANFIREFKHLAEDAVLKGQPYGDEKCDNCLFYLNPDDKLAYCWHPKLRILVGAEWWCQWWEKID